MKTNLLPRLTYWIVLLVASATGARATDYYMSLSGSGTKDGSSWTNSFAITSGSTVLNTTMQPGDTVYLDGGPYGTSRFAPITSGSAGLQKSIIGVDRGAGLPLFQDTSRARVGLTIANSCGYWTFQNLKYDTWDVSITTSGTIHPGLVFDNVTTNNNHRGFVFVDADGILVQNCRADKYTEFGFYFANSCDGVTVKNTVADCTGTGEGDDAAWKAAISNPVGFNFHFKGSTAPFNTNILLEDCEAINNDSDNGAAYEQGDGFKMEDRNDGVTLRRCLSHKNQDGAVDLKGTNQLLEDCISWNNKRYGFKVWYSGTLNNCIAVDNHQWAFQEPDTGTGGHTITANNCTFACTSASPGYGINIATSGNTINLNNCLLTFSGTAGTYTLGPGAIKFYGSALANNASNSAIGPRYVNPVLPWDGAGTDYDSQTFGSFKGYNSAGEAYHLSGGTRYECELIATATSSDAVTIFGDPILSGTAAEKLASNAINDYISYTLPSVPAGTYTVTVGARGLNTRGQFQLAIDGVNQGAVQDQYSATTSYITHDLGAKTFATTGNKVFNFNVTGKNASSSGYDLTFDYIELTPVTGGIIGVHLAESGSSANLLLPTDIVGAVESANWNNSTVNNEVLTNVLDNSGNATTADISFSKTAAGYANATGTFAAPMADDSKMMRSTRAMSNESTMGATAAQIPYALYDVYVYWGGRTSGETVPATMSVDFMLMSGTTWVTSQTLYMRDDNHAWDGTYNESIATTGTAAVDGNDYVVFRNQTAPTFHISATCGRRTGFNGFQIIEK